MDGARHLDPNARTAWSIVGLGFASPVLVLVAVLGIALFSDEEPVWGALTVLAAFGLAVAVVAWARKAWQRFTYTASDDALEIHKGVLQRQQSYVPYLRIQQIDIERGPLHRMLGLAKLVLRTASATTDATLSGLSVAEADELRAHLLARAGRDDAV